MARHLNALKTGMYATTAILPGESSEPYKKSLESLIDCFRPGDLVEFMHVIELGEIAWRRRRLSLRPDVGVCDHQFARALAQSGAQTVEEFLRKREAAQGDVMKRTSDALCQMMKKVAERERNSESEDFGELAREILVHFRACRKSLAKIADDFDEIKSLRREFSLENLERFIKVLNALGSLWDKTSNRLLVYREARVRERQTEGVTAQPQANFDAASLLKEMFGELSKTEKQDADDLDADDEEADPLEDFMRDTEDDKTDNLEAGGEEGGSKAGRDPNE